MACVIKIAVTAVWLLLSAIIVQAAEPIRINGSGSAVNILKPLIEAYKKTDRKAVFEITKPVGSASAIKAISNGALDIVISSKQLSEEDVAKGCTLKEFGKTPLVIVTEKSVKKSNITTRELEDIYSGTTTNWPGGEKIRLVLRSNWDTNTAILKVLSAGMSTAMAIAQSRRGMVMEYNDPDSVTAISNTPGAMGATGLTSIIADSPPLNVLSLNKVKPSVKTVANGTYPLAKEINFITTAKTSAAALKFLKFVYSQQGRAIAEKAGVLVTAGH